MRRLFCVGLASILSIYSYISPINKIGEYIKKVKEPSLQTITLEDTKVSTKTIKSLGNNISVNLNIPVIKGWKDKKIQDEFNAKIYNDVMDFKGKVEKLALEHQKETRGNMWEDTKYMANVSYKVTYNKKGILSIPINYYQYTGETYGIACIKSFNINLKTGKTIALKELFKNEFNYKDAISKEIIKQMNFKKEIYFESAIKNVSTISEEQPFYIEDNCIIICFGPYELTPNVSEIPQFKIPFSLFNNEIKDEFLK